MSAPVQPVTVSVAELTAIKTALTDRASWFHVQAANAPAHDRARLVEAARLSFARPGEPIQVVGQ
jgi:hypothetical protein